MIRGEIWWVDLGIPFGSEPGFRRPVIIVQDDAFNESAIRTVICIPLTTNLNLQDAPGNVFLAKKETDLSKDSVAIVSSIVTLDRQRFLEHAGKLKNRMMSRVDDGLKLALSL
jgi:mRNA interferase MazF